MSSSTRPSHPSDAEPEPSPRGGARKPANRKDATRSFLDEINYPHTVSYTHLTLPTKA